MHVHRRPCRVEAAGRVHALHRRHGLPVADRRAGNLETSVRDIGGKAHEVPVGTRDVHPHVEGFQRSVAQVFERPAARVHRSVARPVDGQIVDGQSAQGNVGRDVRPLPAAFHNAFQSHARAVEVDRKLIEGETPRFVFETADRSQPADRERTPGA